MDFRSGMSVGLDFCKYRHGYVDGDIISWSAVFIGTAWSAGH